MSISFPGRTRLGVDSNVHKCCTAFLQFLQFVWVRPGIWHPDTTHLSARDPEPEAAPGLLERFGCGAAVTSSSSDVRSSVGLDFFMGFFEARGGGSTDFFVAFFEARGGGGSLRRRLLRCLRLTTFRIPRSRPLLRVTSYGP